MSKKRTSLREVEWWWQRGWDPGLLRPNISIPRQKKKKSRPGTAGQKARVKMSQEVVRNIVSPPQKRKRNASFEPKSASVV